MDKNSIFSNYNFFNNKFKYTHFNNFDIFFKKINDDIFNFLYRINKIYTLNYNNIIYKPMIFLEVSGLRLDIKEFLIPKTTVQFFDKKVNFNRLCFNLDFLFKKYEKEFFYFNFYIKKYTNIFTLKENLSDNDYKIKEILLNYNPAYNIHINLINIIIYFIFKIYNNYFQKNNNEYFSLNDYNLEMILKEINYNGLLNILKRNKSFIMDNCLNFIMEMNFNYLLNKFNKSLFYEKKEILQKIYFILSNKFISYLVEVINVYYTEFENLFKIRDFELISIKCKYNNFININKQIYLNKIICI